MSGTVPLWSGNGLPGSLGNWGEVFREGDTVVRPADPFSGSTTLLLEALARTGFPAPVPLGRTADGAERFAFIAGDVPVSPLPDWAVTPEALRSAGRLLRAYHKAVARIDLPGTLEWSSECADPEGGPIICHNDVGPPNVVFRDGSAYALLDFDFAAPGRPVWDLAQAARMWIKLRPPDMRGSRSAIDPFVSLRALVEGYGLPATDHREFVEAIADSWRGGGEFVRRRVAGGQAAFSQAWERNGGEEGHERVHAWLLSHQGAMLAALS